MFDCVHNLKILRREKRENFGGFEGKKWNLEWW